MTTKKKIAGQRAKNIAKHVGTMPGDALVPKHAVKVEEFLVDSPRALITIGPESAAWGSGAEAVPIDDARGAIVRLKPPAGATTEAVSALKQGLLSRGARQVLATAPAHSAAPLPEEAIARERAPSLTARQVVGALVEESQHPDKPALAALCERILSENGL